jgi:CPA1 family monovalent cation:H+ antiporter
VFIISWAGMRGAVSLAAALALPRELAERDLLVFLTFCVILATLVGQGLTLPVLIRLLGIAPDRDDGHEEARVRQVAAEAAVYRIGELEREWPGHQELIDALRAQYLHRASHLEIDGDGPRDEAERELLEHRIIRREVIDAEREAVLRLLERGAVADDVVRRVQRDLDLEELRLEA